MTLTKKMLFNVERPIYLIRSVLMLIPIQRIAASLMFDISVFNCFHKPKTVLGQRSPAWPSQVEWRALRTDRRKIYLYRAFFNIIKVTLLQWCVICTNRCTGRNVIEICRKADERNPQREIVLSYSRLTGSGVRTCLHPGCLGSCSAHMNECQSVSRN